MVERMAALRARYASEIMGWTRQAGFDDPRVEAAFAAVPREGYLTPPPWRVFAPGGLVDVRTSDPAKLYDDVLVALDRGKGINNGQPSLHAAWLAAVRVRPGETVVQVGIGAGYYTAVLAWLVGEGGAVEAYEIEPRLAAIAGANLAGRPQVRVHAASGVATELPAADIVYVSASAAAPDPTWLRALRDGGRLIFPWQPSPDRGTTMLMARAGRGFTARAIIPGVSFVGCVGADIRAARPSVVMPSRHVGETRSAWLTADRPPDASATAVYRDVWFSAEEA